MPGIEWHLRAEVVGEARVRNLDHEQHVGRSRMGRHVEVGPGPQDCDVRLGLADVVEPQRVLAPHDPHRPETLAKMRRQSCDDCRMQHSDRRHVDDLPIDEFHAVVGTEDARFAHPMKRVHRNQMTRRGGTRNRGHDDALDKTCSKYASTYADEVYGRTLRCQSRSVHSCSGARRWLWTQGRYTSLVLPGNATTGFGNAESHARSFGKRSSCDSSVTNFHVTFWPV